MATKTSPTSYFYFFSADLSSSTIKWANSIKCPSVSCNSEHSDSLVSEDGHYVYTMIVYDDKLLYYTFDSDTGSPNQSGLQRSEDGRRVRDLQEMNEFIIVVYELSTRVSYIDFIEPISCTVIKQIGVHAGEIYGLTKIFIHGREYLYLTGAENSEFYMSKYYATDLAEYTWFQDEAPSWVSISTRYNIHTLKYPPQLLNNSGLITILGHNVLGIILFTGFSIKKPVTLWIDDFSKTYTPNHFILIDQIWA